MNNDILDSYEQEQRKFNIYLASFLIPIVIMMGIFVVRGIFPFGDNAFLQCDLYHQYFPFLRLLRNIVKEGGSIIYSWRVGVGTNFFAFFVYYLATPTNWLSLIVNDNFLIEFITYIIILKTGFAGLSFSYYIREKYDNNSRVAVLFSICYAMSAFFAAYDWNVMWLDCLIMLPLIMLGLDRLVYKGRMSLYIIALGYCIFTNYYLSIMICISLVLYFLVLLVSAGGGLMGRLKACLRFAGASFVAGGIASVMLLPEVNSMMYSEFTGGHLPSVWEQYYDFFSCYTRSMMNVQVEIGLDHWPNIYCGVAMLILLALYLFTGSISLKERIPKAILLGVFMFAFCFNIPNFIWHGMNYPNSLPARQSFIYIFIVLTMGYEAFLHLKQTHWVWVFISGAIGIGTVACAYFFVISEAYSMWTFGCSAGFVIVYFGLICLVKRVDSETLPAFYWLALLLVVAEVTTNMLYTGVSTVSRSAYVNEMEKYKILSNYAQARDKSFYRIEKSTKNTQNDSMLSDYTSASLFSSVSNSLVKKFYERYGMRCTKVYYSYEGATPLTSSLLSVKYTMDNRDRGDDPLYELKLKHDNLFLYKNYYCLPLGFMVPPYEGGVKAAPRDVVQRAANKNASGDVFSQQNYLAQDLGAKGDIFKRINNVSSAGSTVIDVPEEGRVYAYVTNSGISSLTATCNGKKTVFPGYTDMYIMDLGYHKAGDIITISTDEISYTLNTTTVMFNEEVFNEMYQSLKLNPFNIQQFSDTFISGTVTADGTKELFLSIPYDLNWVITVDGLETDFKPYDSAFISVPLNEGTHYIELSYRNKYLDIGAIMTVVFVGIWVVIYYYEKRKFYEEDEEEYID